MLNNKKYETKTVNVSLLKTILSNEEPINIPDGTAVRMGVVSRGNAEDRIITVGVFDSNNEIIRTADLKFFEKTSGGNYLDGFMPIDLDGGRQYHVRVTALTGTLVDDVTVQALFIIEKPQK